MKIRRAVITAASPAQRALPLQTLIDRDGREKTVLCILLEEILQAGIEEICVVVGPGDEVPYARAAAVHAGRLRFITQEQPLGYAHAIYSARHFTAGEPFLHLVGDHLYVNPAGDGCARRLVRIADSEDCAVSSVQATRESLLPKFGAVGGRRLPGREGVYRVETVIEKPTPTEAEQKLMVPGMRAGQYLCFFGMHALTPAVMDILGRNLESGGPRAATLSDALAELARHEQYLAYEEHIRRYDIGARYGLLMAQLALALCGEDRTEVLSQIVDLLATREMAAGSGR